MSKQVGFWFYTGDWMKDPELRFCSLFARGLLIDLLCLMFEAKNQGELSKPDGTPRSDLDIANSISGGTQQEKLAALKELVASGALKRDEKTGVLYSSRMRSLKDLKQVRSNAGSKGGKKTQAKSKQNDKQNGGVTDTDTDSDSSIDINTHNQPVLDSSKKEETFSNQVVEPVSDALEKLSEAKQDSFQRWLRFRLAMDARWMPVERQDVVLMEMLRLFPADEDWTKSIDFSIRVSAKNVIDWKKDFQRVDDRGLSYGESVWGSGGGA